MVKVEDLVKSFPRADGTILNVLNGITFTVSKGEFCCILGPSGCGKTTLLNIIAGLIPPDSGKITIGNKLNFFPSVKISYVFQKSRLLKWKTVKGNLKFALQAMRIPKNEWEERINYYLDLVGLRGFSNEYPSSLSLGMEKRIALTRGLIIDPDLILMDEPFSSVDEITARELRKDLISIWEKEKKTIIFVTHNVFESISLADNIIILGNIPCKVLKTYQIRLPKDLRLKDPILFEIQNNIFEIMEQNRHHTLEPQGG
jgi:ABC-type nitrate/sulfonate/bicarbonate transport system ATPase subunit